jgi:uncharacterized protein YdeI (YjbR/CyaY-like superfamily)
MATFEGTRTFSARSRAEWRKWLQVHSEQELRIWLIIYHKKSKTPSVHFQEAIEEAICFGWVDSKGKKRSPDSFYLCFSKRNPKSTWGRMSRERADRMTAEGLMTARGLAMIDLAKRTGTWEAHIQAQNTVIPADLHKQLERNASARRNFETFAPSSKRIVLEWISRAKKPETRTRRIVQAVELASSNEIAGLPRQMRENRARKKAPPSPKEKRGGRHRHMEGQ